MVTALDFRDHETEGHAQRVMELTVRLARVLKVPEDELVHLKRGALLHDIGKMAIPDSILLKSGDLDAGEWVIMRRHPQLAYEMLAPIPYLNPALEIPYCHHERWDGSGYPRGLKGQEIPFVARIFAVVDVWDALLSDRPYRPGIVEPQVHAYFGPSPANCLTRVWFKRFWNCNKDPAKFWRGSLIFLVLPGALLVALLLEV